MKPKVMVVALCICATACGSYRDSTGPSPTSAAPAAPKVPTLPGLTTQSLLLTQGSVVWFDGLPSDPPAQLFSGEVLIQWSSNVAERVSGATMWAVCSCPDEGYFSFAYDASGAFRISDSGGGIKLVGSYTPVVAYAFQLRLNLDAHAYALTANGSPLAAGFLDPSLGFSRAVFQAPASSANALALDNFLISVTPSMSATPLMLFQDDFNSEPLGPLSSQPNTGPPPFFRPTGTYVTSAGRVDVIGPQL